ncbi:MAG: hypothetical protein KKH68_11975 [Proteobacteria bacterium]|nr:hypothetical protein [Pseudomonadota bacterium]
MARMTKTAAIILVFIVGFCVQILFAFADCRDTPQKAVVEFSKAYLQLDKSMAKRICSELVTSDDVDVVDNYIYQAYKEARERGFEIKFMKNKLYQIETETISQNDKKAKIRIAGKRRTSINPVYANVATVFNLNQTHEVDATFDVVLEDNQWKICGDLFSHPLF